jgi:hypothetical protein
MHSIGRLPGEDTMSDPIKPHPASAARPPAPNPAEAVSEEGFEPGHELDDWLAAEDAIEAEDAARWSED